MKRRNFLQLLAASAAGAALTMSSAEAKNTGRRVRISAGNRTWYATLDDNATARALIAKLPLTLPLEDLYGRELCYRFRDALPANEVSYRGYEVGEIVYWPPRHSFVILYAQNGEHFDMQPIGRIEKGVEEMGRVGSMKATITLDK